MGSSRQAQFFIRVMNSYFDRILTHQLGLPEGLLIDGLGSKLRFPNIQVKKISRNCEFFAN